MNISHTTTRYYITVFLITMATLVHANTITVMTTMDNGVGSLREAVQSATAGDTIRFSTAIDGQSIMLVTEITLDTNLVIIGNDTTNTIIDGMATSRIFHIPAGDTVYIEGIKMQNGNGVSPNQNFSGTSGGAIHNNGSLTIRDAVISGNSAGRGGGVSNFGLSSSATFSNSVISQNMATDGQGGGVISFNSRSATFINSLVAENEAEEGGGVYVFGSGTPTIITNSTISGNEANSGNGGGMFNDVSQVVITNSVVSGNSADFSGGGVYNSGNFGTATYINSTITGNFANTDGGGIYNGTGQSSLNNTIIAKNSNNGMGVDVFSIGAINDNGNNLIGDNTTVTIEFPSDGILIGTAMSPVDPLFVMAVPSTTTNPSTGGELRLQCGSPAIDAGKSDTTGLNLGLVDLGDNPRIITKTIDIGAYEFQASDAPAPVTLVTNTNDAGCGSLRFAVCHAMPGDTIRFDASLDMDTIKLVTEITLNKNLVIIGNDTTNTIIDGMATSRIFHIPAGDTVYIDGIRMQNGNGGGVQPFAGSNTFGGAIYNQGSATFTNSIISGNTASGSGGGVYNDDIATFTNSNISGNSASVGGGVENFGTTTFTNSTISENTAISRGGGVSNEDIATFTNSTISGNTASNGAGVFNFIGAATFTNSTTSGNSANNGGGVFNDSGTVTFTNSTISGNTASNGAGVENIFGTATFTNSIVAKNTDNGSGPDIFRSSGTITDGGYNLIGDTTSVGSFFTSSTLLGNTSMPLDPLFVMNVPPGSGATTGGDLRLQCGSPAIDAGKSDTTGLNLGLTDILGLPRIESAGGTIDIGAHERPADMGSKIVTTLADDGPGSLRDMVLIACPEDTITFHASLDMDTIKLVTEITLDTNLVIIGNDETNTIIDGMATSRIFHIPAGDTVYIDGIKMQNGNGAGIQFVSSTIGGAILNQGIATFTNSTISGNSASFGGGVYNGSTNATATFTNSTISGNSASSGGGGVYNDNGTATLTNTTISGNSADQGGGVFNFFGATSTFTNSTISGNSANLQGGGVYNIVGMATFTNSIVAKNTDNGSGPDIFRPFGTITDGGYNLIGDNTSVGSFFTSSTLLGNTSMPLDPLFVMNVPTGSGATTGGDLRLQCGSPAIDAGKSDTTGLNLGLVDLGGNPRIITKTIDIGAYEFQASDAPAPVTLVTNTNDAGCGSLRFAVCHAMLGDTIRFDASLDMDTIKLVTEITLDTNLVIIGNDTTNTIIDGMTTSRIFHIPAGDTVAIHNVTLQNGNGAGIQPVPGTNGGAILNQGNLKLTNTVISGNTALAFGGGVYNEGEAIFTNSTTSGNTASNSGGGVFNTNEATFTNTTISGNSASSSGGGVLNLGTATFANTTISGNTASNSGGGVFNAIEATFINTTISGNTASNSGGGVDNSGGIATFTNTIVAKNTDDGSGHDIFRGPGTITDGGYNLIGDTTSVGSFFTSSTLLGNTIMPLDPLFVMIVPTGSGATTGGDLRLQCGSPAIDAGSNAPATTAMVPNTDINGNPRIITKTIDIGAYEFQASDAPAPVTLVTNTNDAGCGSLRFAVCHAMPGDTIRFDASLDMDTIKLVTEITLDTNLVIVGNDTTNTIIDGMANSRIFHIPAGDTVYIDGIKMQNGNGGGVQPIAGGLTFGGAIYNQGSATFTNSTISGNSADEGGGVSNFRTNAMATFTNSTISGNSASNFGGGVSNFGGIATFTNTTISGNTASNFGGSVSNFGRNAMATFTNSTISGNSSTFGGGVSNIGTNAMAAFTNSTISGNSALRDGGGVYNFSTNAMATFTNSIVAKNTGDGFGPDIFSSDTITDGGYNLIGDTTSVGSFFTSSTLLGNTIMPLDPLFVMNVPDNDSLGGDFRLQACSPAINAGSTAALPIDTFDIDMDMDYMEVHPLDLAGMPRVLDEKVDIGAYEFQTKLFSLSCMDTTLYLDMAGMVTLDTSMVIDLLVSACPLDTVYFVDPILDCDDVGSPVFAEIVAVNDRGDTLRCMPVITVLDTIAPVVTCMDTTIYLDVLGMVTIDSSYAIGAISDACGIASAVVSKTGFTCTDIGSNMVTLMANDNNGNSTMCSAIVTVLDTISPVVTCMDTTVYLDANGMALIDTNFVVTSATDACSAVTLLLGQTRFTCDDLGTQEVIVSATDAAGNIGTCVSMVTVLKTPLMVTTITGPSTICPDLSQIAYSAAAISDAVAYQWSYDGTGVIINNQGSNEITLDFTSDVTAGTLTVDVIDLCGDISSSATFDIAIGSGEFCALTDCTRENIYIDDELLGLIGSIDIYRASIMIETNATVATDRNLIFKAGQEVIFYPGFTVEQAGLLEAIIEQCE